MKKNTQKENLEILNVNRYAYRGILTETSEFVYGPYAKLADKHFILQSRDVVMNADIHGGLYDKKTQQELWLYQIRQAPDRCLGQEDIDGNQIFEEDIVDFQHEEFVDFDYDRTPRVRLDPDADDGDTVMRSVVGIDGEVEGNFGDFDYTLIKWAQTDHYFKVVGNTHFNPELLEDRND